MSAMDFLYHSRCPISFNFIFVIASIVVILSLTLFMIVSSFVLCSIQLVLGILLNRHISIVSDPSLPYLPIVRVSRRYNPNSPNVCLIHFFFYTLMFNVLYETIYCLFVAIITDNNIVFYFFIYTTIDTHYDNVVKAQRSFFEK